MLEPLEALLGATVAVVALAVFALMIWANLRTD
jgi:hypothetical protein